MSLKLVIAGEVVVFRVFKQMMGNCLLIGHFSMRGLCKLLFYHVESLQINAWDEAKGKSIFLGFLFILFVKYCNICT